MKKNSKYIVLTAAIALCAGSSLPFLAGSSTLNPERDSVKSEVPYCVTSPSVPDKITFAGQAIDLLRYDHRERMDRELMSFTYMHSTTMLMVKRANRYFPVIEPILKANGLPDDFKYLAVIESNLNPLAKSPAGAAGLWQFMPATGREFGLEVNSNIDERYHIEKETKAACKYLKDAYQKYGNWLCVAAAYNAGQGRISTQLQKQMVDQAVDLWLAWEGLAVVLYYFSFIAINLGVMNLLPIPALDGGRIVGLLLTTLIERITRKKLNPKYEAWINGVGMVLLLLLIAVITFKDIFHLFT